MDKIGIFCSASGSIDKKYFEKTEELGKWMGKHGKTLIYGGACVGLMECIAKAVKGSGGMVIGVVPSLLEENGKVSVWLDYIIKTRDLSDRKDILLRESEVMIALPGGIGTFDEIFHVMAASSMGYHDKKVIFYNIDGFYDDLLKILNGLDEKHFSRQPINRYFRVARTFEELIDLLTSKKYDD